MTDATKSLIKEWHYEQIQLCALYMQLSKAHKAVEDIENAISRKKSSIEELFLDFLEEAKK